MKKLYLVFVLILVSLFPLVSACGIHYEDSQQAVVGFGLLSGSFGGLIQILLLIVLGLVAALYIKNLNK